MLTLLQRSLLEKLAQGSGFDVRNEAREIGIFAPGSKLRHEVVPKRPSTKACHFSRLQPPPNSSSASPSAPPTPAQVPPGPAAKEADPKPAPAPPTRVPWAELLRRTWHLDSLRCPRRNPDEAERFLRHLSLYTQLHPAALSRGPPSARS